MIILGSVIEFFLVDPIIHWNIFLPFGPEKIDQANAVSEFMGIAAVLLFSQLIDSWIFLVKKSVVAYEIAGFDLNFKETWTSFNFCSKIGMLWGILSFLIVWPNFWIQKNAYISMDFNSKLFIYV